MSWQNRPVPHERLTPDVLDLAFAIQLRGHGAARELLALRRPELAAEELDRCVAIVNAANRHLDQIYDSLSKRSPDGRPDARDFDRRARAAIRWLSASNIGGYYSQCVYGDRR